MDKRDKDFIKAMRSHGHKAMLKGHAARKAPPHHIPPATPVADPNMHAEPDADDRGGPPDNDADDMRRMR